MLVKCLWKFKVWYHVIGGLFIICVWLTVETQNKPDFKNAQQVKLIMHPSFLSVNDRDRNFWTAGTGTGIGRFWPGPGLVDFGRDRDRDYFANSNLKLNSFSCELILLYLNLRSILIKTPSWGIGVFNNYYRF